MRTAIVVPGNGSRRLGRHDGIAASCLALVREAERTAASTPVDAVVFTGGSRGRRRSEAELMRATWQGPDVELVIEPTASVTAQNASRTLPLLLERGIERALVICAPLHLYRARFFFSRLYAPRGIETVFLRAHVAPRPRAVIWELGAAAVVRRQLRAAEAELLRLSAP
jgi:uncharacterized SAM-binding protein YcdF (DUF218 family)